MKRTPIQRNENIIALSKDHHFTLLFCWKIRNGLKFGVEASRIINYVQYFWQHHMQPHFVLEETILYVGRKDASVQKAVEEHAEIARLVKTLDLAGYHAGEQLAMLAGLVDNHVRYEERELFPMLERTLPAGELEQIGKQISSRHDAVAKDDYSDAFWVKKPEK